MKRKQSGAQGDFSCLIETFPDKTPSKSKKRNLSQVSVNSASPSPSAKIPNMDKTPGNDAGCEPAEDLDRIKSITGNDTEALHAKMDIMLQLLINMDQKFTTDKTNTEVSISQLKQENDRLKVKLLEAEGQIIRMEGSIHRLSSKCEDLQLRYMSNNLLVYNVPEQRGEVAYDLVMDIFQNKIKIPDHLIHSERNPAAPVQVDIAHRLGKQGTRPRLIVVRLALRRGKEIVYKFVKNLKGTGISITDQLPSEMRERRDVQFQNFKHLKEQHKYDTSVKVKLVRDRIYINNTETPSRFEKNSLLLNNMENDVSYKFEDMVHSEVIEESQSFFQGHTQEVNSMAEAQASYKALFQNQSTASASHISYAYVVGDGLNFLSGYSDDGETGASDVLKKLIHERSLKNVFFAVSRKHQGPNLGKRRFELIKSVASEVISKIDLK